VELLIIIIFNFRFIITLSTYLVNWFFKKFHFY